MLYYLSETNNDILDFLFNQISDYWLIIQFKKKTEFFNVTAELIKQLSYYFRVYSHY